MTDRGNLPVLTIAGRSLPVQMRELSQDTEDILSNAFAHKTRREGEKEGEKGQKKTHYKWNAAAQR